MINKITTSRRIDCSRSSCNPSSNHRWWQRSELHSPTHVTEERDDSSPTVRVGIPRAIHYYCYPGLWQTFLGELGIDHMVSPPTTVGTVKRASLISESEHCLPMKLLDAHVDALVGQVDAVLVPRLLSMCKKHRSCTKLGYLPDAVAAHVRGRVRVIGIEMDEDSRTIQRALHLLAVEVGASKSRTRAATERALVELRISQKRQVKPLQADALAPVLLIGHPYLLHEDYIAGPVMRKLHEMRVPIRFLQPDVTPPEVDIIAWDTCSKMYRGVLALRPNEVAGVIQISSFNCGCDSVSTPFYRDALRQRSTPYLLLMLDEHAAQTGIETRLEAFVDSMGW